MRSFGPSPRNHTFRTPTVVASDLEVVLKWFDPARGFGFVKLADGSPDALLPGAVVQAAGHDTLPDGTTLRVDLTEGRKGKQVHAIHSVDVSTATPSRPRPERRPSDRPAGGDRFGGGDRFAGGSRFGDDRYGNERFGGAGGRRNTDGAPRRSADGPTSEMSGTVKWFNATKGFGFITPDDGGRDVFIHVKALERSGLAGLNEQQRVKMSVRQGEKGLEAVSVATA
jgi:cold shock protein